MVHIGRASSTFDFIGYKDGTNYLIEVKSTVHGRTANLSTLQRWMFFKALHVTSGAANILMKNGLLNTKCILCVSEPAVAAGQLRSHENTPDPASLTPITKTKAGPIFAARVKSGEVLTNDSLITPERSSKPLLNASSVGKIARTYMRKVGINLRPYDLRHTFATQLMLAESRGMILRDYRTFFMGHKSLSDPLYLGN